MAAERIYDSLTNLERFVDFGYDETKDQSGKAKEKKILQNLRNVACECLRRCISIRTTIGCTYDVQPVAHTVLYIGNTVRV